jgi:hypothetical protein
MISSTRQFLSGVTSFLVLLKTLSHSADIDTATEGLILPRYEIEGLRGPQRRQQRLIHAEDFQAVGFRSKKAGEMGRNS